MILGWGVLLGLALGVGLWCLVSVAPRLSRPTLADRVAPYVVDASDEARRFVDRRTVDPLPIFGTVLAPVVSALRVGLGSLLGGDASVRIRLRQAGWRMSVEEFRSRQLVWAALGLAVGVAISAALATTRPIAPALAVALPAVTAGCGVALQDWRLRTRANRRVRRIADELPTVMEFLSLSLSAGEGILDAVRRLSRVGTGELARELGATVAEVSTGIPFARALTSTAAGLGLPALDRAIAAIVGALERGTPLAEVLRAQAQDSRSDAKKRLLEVAGKKEVAMLVPLVFLILPITILFAIFPGIVVLQTGF